MAAVVLVPALGALVVARLGRRPVAAGAVVAVVLTATLASALTAGAWGWTASLRWSDALALQLEADGIGRVMAVLVPAIALPVVVSATATEGGEPGLGRLLGLMVAFVAAMELLVTAADFLTLLLGWELVGAASWALIAHRWRDAAVPPAATQAFVTTRLGDLGLYLAAGAAFAASGSLAFADLPGGGGELDVVAAGLLLAAAAKSAQLPFSPWLFSAMAGPTPVSALLHSATMVAAGAYALARLAPALEPTGWFAPAVAALGLTTALAGGVVASVQRDMKRALAASTSAQYGLVLVAVGAGSTAAAGAHLVTHAAFKSLLFLAAGVALHAAGTGDLARMRLGRSQRAAAVLAGVGALALAAVPPMGGAFSKGAVAAAAAERWWWAGAGVVVAGVLSAFYAGRLHLLAFGPGQGEAARPSGGERVRLAAMAVLAFASLALSALWLPGPRRIIERTVAGAVPEEGAGQIALALALAIVALGAAAVLDRRGRLVDLRLPARVQHAVAGWMGLPVLARVAVVDPVLALARALAAFDDRVVDAGVRAAAAIAGALSRALAWWSERGVDGVVWGVAGAALAAARGSRRVDDGGVDVAVEGVAGGVGHAGRASRRLQDGMAHHYYVIATIGALALMVLLALGSL